MEFADTILHLNSQKNEGFEEFGTFLRIEYVKLKSMNRRCLKRYIREISGKDIDYLIDYYTDEGIYSEIILGIQDKAKKNTFEKVNKLFSNEKDEYKEVINNILYKLTGLTYPEIIEQYQIKEGSLF